VDLSYSQVRGWVYAWRARFQKEAMFRQLLVAPGAGPDRSYVWPGEANFSWAWFQGEARFERCRFEGTMLELRTIPGAQVAVGLAWHGDGNVYFHSGGDPGIFTLTGFKPARGQAFVFFSNGGDDSILPGMLRQAFVINRIQNLMKHHLTQKT
jgi:hypothetical protein